MRDLGLMGESTFVSWCAQVGLIPNGSQIDKTGWDFLVEFPFSSGLSPQEIHKSAFECKVQVKATDNRERKLPIKLSNLRRLATAQMPVFFVFLEFDGESSVQKAFVVHVNNELITKILKKLHKTEQSDKENNFNKRKMTIHYTNKNLINELSGESLKARFIKEIGNDAAEYIARKKKHLESTGYENGMANFTFTTEGENDLKKLIDVSIGIEEEVEISSFKGINTRFGIMSNNPFVACSTGKISMPGLKPMTKGRIIFKEGKFSPVLSFKADLYNSPLNQVVPDELKKIRVKGEFFELHLHPFTNEASFSFSLPEDSRLEINKFRDAIKLLNLLNCKNKQLISEFIFDDFPKLKFHVECETQEFDFSDKLKTIESAIKIIIEFGITEHTSISTSEIIKYRNLILEMDVILNSSESTYRIEFGVEGDDYNEDKETAFICLITAPIGNHILGCILTITGKIEKLDNNKYLLIANNRIVEQKIISSREDIIDHEDLVAAIESIERKYENDFSVVTMFNKKLQK